MGYSDGHFDAEKRKLGKLFFFLQRCLHSIGWIYRCGMEGVTDMKSACKIPFNGDSRLGSKSIMRTFCRLHAR